MCEGSVGGMWLATGYGSQSLNLHDSLLHLQSYICLGEGASTQGCTQIPFALGGNLNPGVVECFGGCGQVYFLHNQPGFVWLVK